MSKKTRHNTKAINEISCICCGKILKSFFGNNKTKCGECGSTNPCTLDRDVIHDGGVNNFSLG